MPKKYEPKYWGHVGKYEKEYKELYAKLVPQSGAADTPHGELLRTMSNWYYDKYNNGDCNGRGSEFRRAANAVGFKYREPFTDMEWDRLTDRVIRYAMKQEAAK